MSTETKKKGNGGQPDKEKPPKAFEIIIDLAPYEVTEKEMTARAILGLAGKSADEFYLVEIKGKKERDSYKDRPDELIKLHPGSSFSAVSTGGTPVS